MRIIITGASGMVGEGVLLTALKDPRIEKVMVVGRKPCGHVSDKLTEIFVADFFQLEEITDAVKTFNANACFFCLGVTSVGKKEPEYTRLTFDLTLNFARFLQQISPELSFCYVSGVGTDSTEKGRVMWARVKGKTENELTKVGFKAVYNFRPGVLIPVEGALNTLTYYKKFKFLIPLTKMLYPKGICYLSQMGTTMIDLCSTQPLSKIVDVAEMKKAAL